MPGSVEGPANRCNPAIHHVAWRNDIRTRGGVRNGGFAEPIECGVIVDIAVSDQATVAMRGVLAVADIGNHQ